jgi:hypothetical protein
MRNLLAFCLLSLLPLALPAQGGWHFWVLGGLTVNLPATVNSANQLVPPLIDTGNSPDFYTANISRQVEGLWGWQGGVEMRYRWGNPLSFSWGLEGLQTAFGRTERVLIDPASPGAPAPNSILDAPRPVDTRLTYLSLPLQAHYAFLDGKVEAQAGLSLLGLIRARQDYRIVREEVDQVNNSVSYFSETAQSTDLQQLQRLLPGLRAGLSLFPLEQVRVEVLYHYLPGNAFAPDDPDPPVTPGLEVQQQLVSVRVGIRLL